MVWATRNSVPIMPLVSSHKCRRQAEDTTKNLWLFGDEGSVTEAGTMNLFVAMKTKETGQPELVTAPLDGTILEGVTRDSILALARERLAPKAGK